MERQDVSFEKVNGDLEALTEAYWEKETREALQDRCLRG